jgi:toxin YoeB
VNAPLKSIESERFLSEYKKLRKIPGTIRKLESLMREVVIHPRMGLGDPKPLAGYESREVWSRNISGKHCLVYEIKSDCVVFITCYRHYQDH